MSNKAEWLFCGEHCRFRHPVGLNATKTKSLLHRRGQPAKPIIEPIASADTDRSGASSHVIYVLFGARGFPRAGGSALPEWKRRNEPGLRG
jgi:hypothetical protein